MNTMSVGASPSPKGGGSRLGSSRNRPLFRTQLPIVGTSNSPVSKILLRNADTRNFYCLYLHGSYYSFEPPDFHLVKNGNENKNRDGGAAVLMNMMMPACEGSGSPPPAATGR